MFSIIFWIAYVLGMVLNCIDKLLVFPCVLIVLLLLQNSFCFAVRETSDKNQANVIEAFNSTSIFRSEIVLLVYD